MVWLEKPVALTVMMGSLAYPEPRFSMYTKSANNVTCQTRSRNTTARNVKASKHHKKIYKRGLGSALDVFEAMRMTEDEMEASRSRVMMRKINPSAVVSRYSWVAVGVNGTEKAAASTGPDSYEP